MGAYTRRRGPEFDEDLARVFALFPRVEERLRQLAGTLVGRRAADGGDRPGADGAARSSCAWTSRRWACRRPMSSRSSTSSRDQPAGHDDLHGRAERQHGAVDRRPRLCAADGRRSCSAAPPAELRENEHDPRRLSRRNDSAIGTGLREQPPRRAAIPATRRRRRRDAVARRCCRSPLGVGYNTPRSLPREERRRWICSTTWIFPAGCSA